MARVLNLTLGKFREATKDLPDTGKIRVYVDAHCESTAVSCFRPTDEVRDDVVVSGNHIVITIGYDVRLADFKPEKPGKVKKPKGVCCSKPGQACGD